MYHERQVGNYCRKHSINNLMGKELINIADFDKLCDDFDKANNFDRQCSRKDHLFYNYGAEDNIFGFALRNKGVEVKMIGYDNWRKEDIDLETNKDDLLGAFVFKEGHVWCVRYIDGKFHSIDSNGLVKEVKENYFKDKKLSFLLVYRDLKFYFEK